MKVFTWLVSTYKDTYKNWDFSSVSIVWIQTPESLFELQILNKANQLTAKATGDVTYLLKLHVKLEIQMQPISACTPWPAAPHRASVLEMHNEVLNHPAWM